MPLLGGEWLHRVGRLLPPFYTARYVEVRSPALSLVWLICGLLIVNYTLVASLLGQHNYVQREAPNIDVTFWQERATDGRWWPSPSGRPALYCDMDFVTSDTKDGMSWGSRSIGCRRPGSTPGTYFYPSSNQMLVALSIAYGKDPQYNSSEVYIYEDIESSTIGFQLSFITSRESVSHVPDCKVIGDEEHPDGDTVVSRYDELFPRHDYGEGYLVLSVNDILRATGRVLDSDGWEGPLRLTGLEIAAKFSVRNYHEEHCARWKRTDNDDKAFRWPFPWWNPLGAKLAREPECTVRFEVLRTAFTPVKFFYDRTEPVAVQHGVRLVAVGSGSVGHFSLAVLLKELLVAFAAFGFAQVILDLGWYYFFHESSTIAAAAYAPVEFPVIEGLPFRIPSRGKRE